MIFECTVQEFDSPGTSALDHTQEAATAAFN